MTTPQGMLAPCPFCGKIPKSKTYMSIEQQPYGLEIKCCDVHISEADASKAASKWNARQAAAPQGREALAKIRKLADAPDPCSPAPERLQAIMIICDDALTPAVAPDGAGEALSDLSRTIDTIENAYTFECEAGPLKNCGEWKYLKRLVAALAQAQEPTLTEEQMQGAMTQAREAASRVEADAYIDPASKRVPMGQAQEPGENKPIAWRYELAHAGWDKDTYRLWNFHLSETEPRVPEGSIRNLTPLYAAPPPQVDSGREEIARIAKEFVDSALRWYPVFDDGRGGNDLTAEQTSELICGRLALALRPERSGGRA